MRRCQKTVRHGVAALLTGLLMGSGATFAAEVVTSDPSLSIDEVLAQAYSGVSANQVPTGILLERGAIYGGELVLRHDGGGAAALSPDGFKTAYMDLVRGNFSAHLPSLEMLNATARPWREGAQATPISLAIIDYTTLINTPAPRYDGRVLDLPAGTLGETQTFVGALAVTDKVFHWAPTFVIPSDLFLFSSVDPGVLGDLAVRIGTAPKQAVQFDVPFQPEWLPTGPGPLEFTVSVSIDGVDLATTGTVPYHGPDGGPMAPPHGPPPPSGPRNNPVIACTGGWWHAPGVAGTELLKFWDFDDPVTGGPFAAPWDEPFQTSDNGQLNIRIIPSDESKVTEVAGEGFIFELTKPVVLLDGFDVLNNRTQNNILEDFGGTIKKLLDLGFDIISVDYQNGRDWIERNGRAFRTLMTVDIVDVVEKSALEKTGVAVVAGSMGTQVGRWGLMEAETNGEDHYTKLFVNIDGPFFGATIPIGFQLAAVDLASMTPVAAAFRAALESPAASEMLMRSFPRGGTFFSPGWYAPRPEFTSYYAAAAALGGLPQKSRNVSGASGSGTGSLQTSFGPDVRLLRASGQTGGFFGSGEFFVEVRTDGAGARVYEREIKKKLFGITIESEAVWADLPGGLGLDIFPGGFRYTTHDFIGGIGPTITLDDNTIDVDYSFDLDHHSFVPTTSAFGSELWDNRTWQKCNTQHASAAPALESLVLSELVGFCDGEIPPPATLFNTPCGQVEPVENCAPGVMWYADPAEPTFIQPSYDGANCYVKSCPAGYDATTASNSYAVAPDGLSCFDGSQPVGADCPYTTVTANNAIWASIPVPGLLHIEVLSPGGGAGGPSTCPANTTFIEVINMAPDPVEVVVCKIQPPTGVPFSAFYLDGFTVMIAPNVTCSLGVPKFLGGQIRCFLGIAPDGTSAFKYGSNFYYNGWD